MNRKLTPIALLLLGVTALTYVGSLDYQDEQDAKDHYCIMVKIWNDHRHLPPEQRPGWPPYDGKCDGHFDEVEDG